MRYQHDTQKLEKLQFFTHKNFNPMDGKDYLVDIWLPVPPATNHDMLRAKEHLLRSPTSKPVSFEAQQHEEGTLPIAWWNVGSSGWNVGKVPKVLFSQPWM